MGKGYSKEDGELEPQSLKVLKVDTIQTIAPVEFRDIPKEYSKQDGRLDPSLFIIISGGEEREKDYFSVFKNTSTFPRIIIEFITKNSVGRGGLDVDELIPLAISIKNEKNESKGSDISDSIYVVTDVDHFYSQILRNLTICNDENINLIISNPCFEIWLYYTYFERTPDFPIPENKLKISSTFKTYLNKKIKGGIKPKNAPFYIEISIKNSQANYNLDKNEIPEIFSTQMHLLATRLYDLTKDELNRLIEEKEIQVRQFVNKNKTIAYAKRLNRLSEKDLLTLKELISNLIKDKT